MKKLLFIGTILFVFLGNNLVQAVEIKVGVMAPRGNIKAMKRWAEVGKYLQIETGIKVKIVPLKPSKTIDAVKSGKVDFMLANPVLTLTLREKLNATPIATMKKKHGAQFAGVIVSKKGSGIVKAEDLKNKKVMGFKFKRSAAAYVFQVKHMKDKGINPHKDFAVFKEAKRQDDIVLGVKSGTFDAGFVKSGLLEAMAKEGKIDMANFNIVDQKIDSLKVVHTTDLYPEWYMSAAKSVDAGVSAKIKASLLKLEGGSTASKKAKIVGFVEPLNLATLEKTLKSLKLPPYN